MWSALLEETFKVNLSVSSECMVERRAVQMSRAHQAADEPQHHEKQRNRMRSFAQIRFVTICLVHVENLQ